ELCSGTRGRCPAPDNDLLPDGRRAEWQLLSGRASLPRSTPDARFFSGCGLTIATHAVGKEPPPAAGEPDSMTVQTRQRGRTLIRRTAARRRRRAGLPPPPGPADSR